MCHRQQHGSKTQKSVRATGARPVFRPPGMQLSRGVMRTLVYLLTGWTQGQDHVFCAVRPFLLLRLRQSAALNDCKMHKKHIKTSIAYYTSWPKLVPTSCSCPILVLVKQKKNMTRGKLYLLQFLPVVVTVPDYHGPELCGLEEFQDLPTTYFQEASGKGCVPLMDGEVEDVIYIGFNKFFPRALRESR